MTQSIWLVSTAHLENRLWFLDEDDFKTGMNLVAITTTKVPVRVLSFILMSNHVHFILKGKREDAEGFISTFKQTYSRYYQRKYGVKELLRRNKVDIRLIPHQQEAREKAMAYVHMNCVSANICASPSDYPWGSGACPFQLNPPKGMPLGDMSDRARFRLFHSKAEVPGEWLVGDDGYILPQSYVDVREMESIFRTPQRMNYFLRSSSKARMRVETNESALPSFRDQTVLVALGDLLRTLFHHTDFDQLSEEQKAEFFRQIRFRFAASISQIARVTGVSYETVAKLLDGV